ncbi:hypothetical protein CDV36_014069 [Fusarium kuroshium]|uniref:Major facilitator superfamily (MFS) profile domain-containing protein n=1 Tax=Fusarium kuroshium TaxID=2010991 RepID=A0A3M2RK57_9HYPO|nr:hypothetical protein CDV36_014069 [Fusarium kuroshium]
MSSQSQHFLLDTPVGSFLRMVADRKWLRFPEEQDDFQCPLSQANQDSPGPQPPPIDDKDRKDGAFSKGRGRQESPGYTSTVEETSIESLDQTPRLECFPSRANEQRYAGGRTVDEEKQSPLNGACSPGGSRIIVDCVYSGVVYGIYYSFFEVLPFVYEGIYQLPLDMASLAYLSVVAGLFLIGIPYCSYIYFYALPLSQKGVSIAPGQRLIPALFSSFLVPGGLFLFAWIPRPSIHWMVPTLGIVMTSAGIVIIIQCIFVYLSLSYPMYAASAFGGNSFLRSLIAFAALLWSKPLYHRLGVGGGSSLLGGLCIFGVAGIFILYRSGATLRMKSSFTG